MRQTIWKSVVFLVSNVKRLSFRFNLLRIGPPPTVEEVSVTFWYISPLTCWGFDASLHWLVGDCYISPLPGRVWCISPLPAWAGFWCISTLPGRRFDTSLHCLVRFWCISLLPGRVLMHLSTAWSGYDASLYCLVRGLTHLSTALSRFWFISPLLGRGVDASLHCLVEVLIYLSSAWSGVDPSGRGLIHLFTAWSEFWCISPLLGWGFHVSLRCLVGVSMHLSTAWSRSQNYVRDVSHIIPDLYNSEGISWQMLWRERFCHLIINWFS